MAGWGNLDSDSLSKSASPRGPNAGDGEYTGSWPGKQNGTRDTVSSEVQTLFVSWANPDGDSVYHLLRMPHLGIGYNHIPPWLAFVKGPSRAGSIIIGIAGMFACLILFLLGALVARLK